MTIDTLIRSMSDLKCKLVLQDDFDKERFNRAYNNAIDLLIYKTGNVCELIAEYKYFKSLVH